MGRVTASGLLNLLLQRASASTRRSAPPSPPPVLLHAISGDLGRAISLLGNHTAPNPIPDTAYAALFRLCASRRALVEARRVHCHLLASRPPTFLLNRAIEAFAKCGCLRDARDLFDEMPHRDGGTWNAIIVAYAQMGLPEDVVAVFSRMCRASLRGNHVTFASVLGACGDLLALRLALQIHAIAFSLGFLGELIIGCSLVDSYGKCGQMDDARAVFDSMPGWNCVAWNVIIRRYLELGMMQDAIFMFFQMVEAGFVPMNYTISNALKACSGILALEEGRQVHGIAARIGLQWDNVVGTSLTEMYAKCGLLDEARRCFDRTRSRDVACWTSMVSLYAVNGRMEEAEELFNEMPLRNVISWNAMLAGYVQSLSWERALDFFHKMQSEIDGIDHVTVMLISNLCAGLPDLEKGKQVHGFAYRHGFTAAPAVGNSLLDMYGKCGSLKASETWFNEMGSMKDVVSWNTLIRNFASHKRGESALVAFRAMQLHANPNHLTFSSVLAACANLCSLKRGKQIHGYLITSGYIQESMLSASLINMYSRCRSLELATMVFSVERSRDLFLWNSIIFGCTYNGYGRDALDLFEEMASEDVKPDSATFLGILRACISEGRTDLGQHYFGMMTEKHGMLPLLDHYDCMIDLFGRHGHFVELEEFIQTMPFEPTISMWTRTLDYCCKYRNHRLRDEAAKHINKLKSQDCLELHVV